MMSYFTPKIISKYIITPLCILLLLSYICPPSVLASGESASHWYCPRGQNHAQPYFPEDLSVVEGYGGYYIDHRHTSPEHPEKIVYLTFDAGYENGNVAKILDTLKEKDVSAAFFVLGHLCESYPSLLKRMADEGHLICNHTYTHQDTTKAPQGTLTEELLRLESAMQEIGVPLAKYFRPPEGTFNRQILQEAQSLGYKSIFWSFAYADWDNQNQPSPALAKEKILKCIHNGAVILLHPTSSTNAQILGDVIDELKHQGYTFGTLHQLIGG